MGQEDITSNIYIYLPIYIFKIRKAKYFTEKFRRLLFMCHGPNCATWPSLDAKGLRLKKKK